MIYIPAEVEFDDNSIIEQINLVKKEISTLDSELFRLRGLLVGAVVKVKGDSKESPKS